MRLRGTRAAPPELASVDPERRDVFSAALQQSEDLFAAAAAVGPFARPLPLFYALSQAGRAIAAARSSTDWPVSGHGLVEDRGTEGWESGDILRFQVSPTKKSGVFGAVARVLGVEGLTAPVEVGALWSALPGTTGPPRVDWPVALPVWPQIYGERLTLHLGATHRGYVALRKETDATNAGAINSLLARYPAAAGAQVQVIQSIIQGHNTPWGYGVPVGWPAPSVDMPTQGPAPKEYLDSQVHVRVPQYRHQREHWLIPSVGVGDDELPALLLWWVLLFALSLLARYEPAAWRAALDPDSSDLAVPLEELLDEALGVTPALLFEALTGQSALLPARI